MTRSEFYLLIILSLFLSAVSAIKHRRPPLRKIVLRNTGAISRTDVPTAEQILGKLLGLTKNKAPEQAAYATPPQTLPVYPPGSTPQARSPYKIFGATGATPQTEDNPGPGGYPSLPAPPPGYHYGRPRRRKRPPSEDEYERDDGAEEEEEEEDPEREQDDQPLEDDYKDMRVGGHRRGRGRCRHLGRNLDQRCGQGCKCICWKGIKPHIQWVRVPVCYRPCGVCCPKHEEQGACAAICHPCCHCCHCCCHHPCCHCCHCCHCCRRSMTFRPPLAPPKVKKLKNKKRSKKAKVNKKKSIVKTKTVKRQR